MTDESTMIDILKTASDALADAADAVSDVDTDGEYYRTLRGYQDGIDQIVADVEAESEPT